LRAPLNVGLQINKEVLFISNFNVLLVTWVRSSACLCAIDRIWYARSHVTAQGSHDVGANAMKLGQQVDMECGQSHVLCSSIVVLDHWLCELNAGALDLGLEGSSAVRSITPCALEHTGRDSKSSL
jgi:hypothetical protein